jgi:hypothetical protein
MKDSNFLWAKNIGTKWSRHIGFSCACALYKKVFSKQVGGWHRLKQKSLFKASRWVAPIKVFKDEKITASNLRVLLVVENASEAVPIAIQATIGFERSPPEMHEEMITKTGNGCKHQSSSGQNK